MAQLDAHQRTPWRQSIDALTRPQPVGQSGPTFALPVVRLPSGSCQIRCRRRPLARPIYVPTAHRHLVHRGAGRRRGHRDAWASSRCRKQLTDTVGLVSGLPQFAGAGFRRWDSFVVGGHEIRDGTLGESRRAAADRTAACSIRPLVDACRAELAAIDARIRPGTPGELRRDDRRPGRRRRCSDFAAEPAAATRPSGCKRDLRDFQQQTGVDRVIVVNLASTEPAADDLEPAARAGTTCEAASTTSRHRSLPASSLYAIAALDLGMPYINFTPSLGRDAAGHPRAGRRCAAPATPARTARRAKRCSKACWPRCSPPAIWRS